MSNLQKVVDLINKTGDKAIVLDQNGDPNYVLMSMDDYEQLIVGKSEVRGLTEAELLDKINRDIAVWKEGQKSQDSSFDSISNLPAQAEDLSNFRSFDEAFDADIDQIKEEEGLDEGDEDRFYFESVE
ncbi:MAG: hypothetical protein WC244_01335 [Patescibacteria group bacterium]|jgi:PHD/YefM family antitoxin component YafN of YafNO toxin-antitoxin module